PAPPYGAQLMYVALDQGDWLPHFRQYMAWMYWRWRIEFALFREYQRAGNISGPGIFRSGRLILHALS
ncbi:hypothetical protein, partial [Chitinimonas sp.]|uniref:hypothetical protein n=1 Tax=Chitinimonas sp. TaxID=1934313 RepID=UPI0035AF677C